MDLVIEYGPPGAPLELTSRLTEKVYVEFEQLEHNKFPTIAFQRALT
ncbi:MAG TPA: hypothetical protein VF232_03540 [Gaiellaceae bacterium]